MNYFPEEVRTVLQELPDHMSIVFQIPGCGMSCPGCHSPQLRSPSNGRPLQVSDFRKHLEKYEGYITAVIFLGGEHSPSSMSDFLRIAQARGLKTCLYSGKDKSSISPVILERLDYLKYGPYMESKGGLGSPETNQVMEDLATGENITYKFSNVLPKNNIIRKEENA